MTEEQAKTKWCPHTSTTASGYGEWHTNRPSFHDVEAKGFDLCIGSACMAWRSQGSIPGHVLERKDMGVSDPTAGWERTPRDDPDNRNKSFGDWVRRGPPLPTGYCGLAGVPQ